MMQMGYLNSNEMNKLNEKTSISIINAKEFIDFFSKKENLINEKIIGEIQRNIDKEHLQELIEYHEKYKEKYGIYNFCTPIILCDLNEKYSIIDGQHRFECIKYLLEKNEENFNIILIIIRIDNFEEYDKYFTAINRNKPVYIFKNVQDWKQVMKGVEKYLMDNYKNYIKGTENPIQPHFNIEKLKKYVDENNVISKIGLNYDELISEIEELNKFYKLHWKEKIKNKKYVKDVEKIMERIEKKDGNNKFYLGIYKNFEWLERIVQKIQYKIDYINIEHYSSITARIKIPKKLRQKLWEKYFPNNSKGFCYVCKEEINSFEFECGHVISVFYGGGNEIENMRPICRTCNGDMGIQNLEDYRAKYYSSNQTN